MNRPEHPTPYLDVQRLSKQFGERVAVSGLSLTVRAGELVGLAGPNGSGKSTSLRLLAGLLRADAGVGSVLGCKLGQLDRHCRNRIGYLPQRAALYPRICVYENLRFRAAVAGVKQPSEIARTVVAGLGLADRATESLAQFSGGWTRRIEIAATLIHSPLLVLLDEPTTGLDEEARAHIWRQLDDCRAHGSAVIFSSHDGSELQRATQVVQLSSAHVS
jgi:ABC-2 type transport system ATP-binding protein